MCSKAEQRREAEEAQLLAAAARESGAGASLGSGHRAIMALLALLLAGLSAYIYYSVYTLQGTTVRAAGGRVGVRLRGVCMR